MMDKIVEFLAAWRNRIGALVALVAGALPLIKPEWLVQIVGKDHEAYVLIGLAIIGYVVREYLNRHPASGQETD